MTSLFNFLDYIKIIFGIFSHHIKSLRIWCLTVVIFFDVSCFCFSIFIKIPILNFIIIFLPNPSNMFIFFFLYHMIILCKILWDLIGYIFNYVRKKPCTIDPELNAFMKISAAKTAPSIQLHSLHTLPPWWAAQLGINVISITDL